MLLLFLLPLLVVHFLDVFPQGFHLDRIVHEFLSVLGLSFLDGDQGILQDLPLDVHLVASFACEDTARGTVVLNIIDLPHGAIRIKVLANLLAQEILLMVDLTDRIVHPVCAFFLRHPGRVGIILKEVTYMSGLVRGYFIHQLIESRSAQLSVIGITLTSVTSRPPLLWPELCRTRFG